MKKDGEIDYDRESDIFPSLILLLKAKSSHFVDVINSKVSYLESGIHSTTSVSIPLSLSSCGLFVFHFATKLF